MSVAGPTEIIRRAVPTLPQRLHANNVLHRVLASRGVAASTELNYALADLPTPDELPDIDLACQRLLKAHVEQESVLIVGDYDCDGATSTALMMRALGEMGYTRLAYVIPDRVKHGYGLSPAVVNLGIEQHRPSLIVTVDNGVSAHEAIDYATSQKIDVVVTDHHLPGETLPEAVAVVNPARSDSRFATKNIAGVGVAFYVLIALRKKLLEAGRLARSVRLADWLDLVAIGTVADVVPLDSVNRTLVEQGLRRIRGRACVPGVLALLNAADKDASVVSSTDIGMTLGPRLNAAGRIDDMQVGVQCLLADDVQTATLLANSLQGLNSQRRTIQREIQDDAERIVEAVAESTGPSTDVFAYAVADPTWHQGVIGIVAGRLKDQLGVPVVVFTADGEDQLKGSARSVPGVNIRDVFYQISLALPEVVGRFGGHAMAAGLTIRADGFSAFQQALVAEVTRVLDGKVPVKSFQSDGALALDELTLDTAQLLAYAAPWGTQFEAPLFDNACVVESSKLVGEGRHLQAQLRPIEESTGRVGAAVPAILFGDTRVLSPGDTVHAVYELSVNRYRGRESVQMILRHLAAP